MTFVPYYAPPGWSFIARENYVQSLAEWSDSPTRHFAAPVQSEDLTFHAFCDGFIVPDNEGWMIQRAAIIGPGIERVAVPPAIFALVTSEPTDIIGGLARTNSARTINRWDNHTPAAANLQTVVDDFGGAGYWVGPGERFGAYIVQDIADVPDGQPLSEDWWTLRIQADRYRRA